MPRSPTVYSLPPGTTPQSPNTVIGSAMFNAAMDDIASTFNTAQPVPYGGTGLTSVVSGDILYASAANTIARLAKGTAGQALVMNSGGTFPEWASAGISPLQTPVPINLALVASVGSNALTIAIKGVDGNDPSASNPVYIPFRNVTATSGVPAWLTLVAATSIVISSGSTLGMTSAVAATLAIVAFNDAGTCRLGILNPILRPLNDGIASSTAEGGAGAADSAGVIYTGTAVTSKAMAVLGYATVTEATAGTWATAPATLKAASAPEANNAIFPSSITRGSPIATTSGTTITATGIPAWANQINIGLTAVSLSGTSSIVLKLGTSGGIVSSGYLGSMALLANTGSVVASTLTTCIGIGNYPNAAGLLNGICILVRTGENSWSAGAQGGYSPNDVTSLGGGSISLSGNLTQLQLGSLNASDTFDAGSITVSYQ